MAFYGLITVSLIELLRQRQSQGGPWLRAKSRPLEGAAASQSSLGMRSDVRMGSFLFRQFTAVWNFFWPLQPSQRPRGDPIWVRPLFPPQQCARSASLRVGAPSLHKKWRCIREKILCYPWEKRFSCFQSHEEINFFQSTCVNKKRDFRQKLSFELPHCGQDRTIRGKANQ